MATQFKSDNPIVRNYQPYAWQRRRSFEFQMLASEIDELGGVLLERFPTSRFFSTKYDSLIYYSSLTKPPYLEEVAFAPSCLEAAKENGVTSAYFRWPWPEDLQSGDSIRLAGGPRHSNKDSREHFRRIGRYLEISWTSRKASYSLKLPPEAMGDKADCEVELISSPVKVSTMYDREDQQTCDFLTEVEKLLMEITTCDYASYDPCTHALINPKRQSSSERRSAGVVHYAMLHNKTYFGFCNRQGKPWEVMGPRPEVREAMRIGNAQER